MIFSTIAAFQVKVPKTMAHIDKEECWKKSRNNVGVQK